jgi:hypothetical protein
VHLIGEATTKSPEQSPSVICLCNSSRQDPKLRRLFHLDLDAADVDPDWINPEHLDHLRNDAQARDLMEEEYRTILDDLEVLRSEVLQTGDHGVNLPVNLKRLIWNAQTKFSCREHRYILQEACLLN